MSSNSALESSDKGDESLDDVLGEDFNSLVQKLPQKDQELRLKMGIPPISSAAEECGADESVPRTKRRKRNEDAKYLETQRRKFFDSFVASCNSGSEELINEMVKTYCLPQCVYREQYVHFVSDALIYRELPSARHIAMYLYKMTVAIPDMVLIIQSQKMKTRRDGSAYMMARIRFRGSYTYRMFMTNWNTDVRQFLRHAKPLKPMVPLSFGAPQNNEGYTTEEPLRRFHDDGFLMIPPEMRSHPWMHATMRSEDGPGQGVPGEGSVISEEEDDEQLFQDLYAALIANEYDGGGLVNSTGDEDDDVGAVDDARSDDRSTIHSSDASDISSGFYNAAWAAGSLFSESAAADGMTFNPNALSMPPPAPQVPHSSAGPLSAPGPSVLSLPPKVSKSTTATAPDSAYPKGNSVASIEIFPTHGTGPDGEPLYMRSPLTVAPQQVIFTAIEREYHYRRKRPNSQTTNTTDGQTTTTSFISADPNFAPYAGPLMPNNVSTSPAKAAAKSTKPDASSSVSLGLQSQSGDSTASNPTASSVATSTPMTNGQSSANVAANAPIPIIEKYKKNDQEIERHYFITADMIKVGTEQTDFLVLDRFPKPLHFDTSTTFIAYFEPHSPKVYRLDSYKRDNTLCRDERVEKYSALAPFPTDQT
eukprot:gene15721-11249_t